MERQAARMMKQKYGEKSPSRSKVCLEKNVFFDVLYVIVLYFSDEILKKNINNDVKNKDSRFCPKYRTSREGNMMTLWNNKAVKSNR